MRSLYLEDHDSFVRYYRRKGDGDPILLIPGLITPAMPLFFDMITHEQLQDRSVILINYPGTGISDFIDCDYHPRLLAEIIGKIIDQETLLNDDFHIMGHSQGGTVGIYLAEMYADRVLSLLISEGNIFPGGGPGTQFITSHTEQEWVGQAFDKQIGDWREKGRTSSYYADLVALQHQSHPISLYRSAYQLVHLDEEVFVKLAALDCDRHFIYGEKNVPQTEEEAMPDTPLRSVLQEVNVQTHVVEGAGHMMMLDNLDGYTQLVRDLTSYRN